MIDSFSGVTKEGFRGDLQGEFQQYLKQEHAGLNLDNCLRMDLHCHDHNSDVPDELWGRLLQLPETWLKTKKLAKVLFKHGASVLTVTNHNQYKL